LKSVTIGVPDVETTASFYADFGLDALPGGWFATQDGGPQLRIVLAPTRRLIEVCVGADDSDDLARITHNLTTIGIDSVRTEDAVIAVERATGVRVHVCVASRQAQPRIAAVAYNGPGRSERIGERAPGVTRLERVRPRKLGHAVIGTTDFATTTAFFVAGLGFAPSDYIGDAGAFLRCSSDHHNILVLRAPVAFLHHTSWQVDDIDEVGRGASTMLAADPERHVWGLGRHHAGSNFFWYLKDPAGNFSEYYADMDSIVDNQTWTPEIFDGARGLFNWGPPPPPSFLHPDDLAVLMTASHSD
jgi:catechol 2,3-dioxygenase-like lactoylglutathione lyase family enzyme